MPEFNISLIPQEDGSVNLQTSESRSHNFPSVDAMRKSISKERWINGFIIGFGGFAALICLATLGFHLWDVAQHTRNFDLDLTVARIGGMSMGVVILMYGLDNLRRNNRILEEIRKRKV